MSVPRSFGVLVFSLGQPMAGNTGSAEESILGKCENHTVPLEDCAEICLGLTPYDKYKGHTESQIKNRAGEKQSAYHTAEFVIHRSMQKHVVV